MALRSHLVTLVAVALLRVHKVTGAQHRSTSVHLCAQSLMALPAHHLTHAFVGM